MAGKYDGLNQVELVKLLEARDRKRKLGLVWERDEIEADRCQNADFVAAEIIPELSDKGSPWGNLVIEADNYDALRWLRMTYQGRIKCIYIDPPYNTGTKDWVYNDKYVNSENAYFHSTWLEFMFRRLVIARDLLSEDGVILVSINDDQRAKLELLMDEAMPGMRIGSFAWRTRTGGNDAKGAFFSENHEHVLVYAKHKFRFSGHEKTYEKYVFWDKVAKDWFRLSDISQPKDMNERENGFYAMYDPNTDTYYPPNPQRVWPAPFPKGGRKDAELEVIRGVMKVFPPDSSTVGIMPSGDQIGKWIDAGRIVFPEDQRVVVWETMEDLLRAIDENDVPLAKKTKKIWRNIPHLDFWVGKRVGFGLPQWVRYKSELKNTNQPLSSWITPLSEAKTVPDGKDADPNEFIISGMNQEGTTAIQDIFGSKAFNYPKPVSLIRELIRQASSPFDIILDFFAGSATTAQAVAELNAEDGGSRRFIMVSSTEATADQPNKNICRDVTAERIRRLNKSDDSRFDGISAEFAYLRTRNISFEDLDYDLEPGHVWIALQAMHDLPLIEFEPDKAWNSHETEDLVLVFATGFDQDFLPWIKSLGQRNVIIYSDAPGQLAHEIGEGNIEVLPARETLVRRFRK